MSVTHSALILADIEGITNIYDLNDKLQYQPEYLNELKVYADALLQHGVHRIVVCDSHDQGNLLFGLPDFFNGEDIQVLSTLANIDFTEKYDFAMMVGFHGMTGSPGILSHSVRFNFQQIAIYSKSLKAEIPIGEVEIYSRWLGSKGIPVILVAGDREATYEGNCFNPYRAVCCVKSFFESAPACRDALYGKIHSCVDLALSLDPSTCLSFDSDPLSITFSHVELPEELLKAGYPIVGEKLIYDTYTAFVEDLYPLVDQLIEFDKKTVATNSEFLRKLRKIAATIDRAEFEHSEIEAVLSKNNLYSMSRKDREKVCSYFNLL